MSRSASTISGSVCPRSAPSERADTTTSTVEPGSTASCVDSVASRRAITPSTPTARPDGAEREASRARSSSAAAAAAQELADLRVVGAGGVLGEDGDVVDDETARPGS